jgi:predicted kinase
VLASGRSVILDASFRAREHRGWVRALATRFAVPVTFVECTCPRERAMQRLAARAQGPSISDGRAEIYDAFLARFEPLDELSPAERLRLDTTGSAEENAAAVLNGLLPSP